MPIRFFASLFALLTLVCVAPIRALRPSRPCQVARLEAAIAQARAAAPPSPEPPSASFVHRPRHARPRPYTAPIVVPDYGRFCETAVRHRALWRLTYEPDERAPFQAHHRAEKDVTLAASDVEALDFALAEFAPPGYARNYLRGSGAAPAPSASEPPSSATTSGAATASTATAPVPAQPIGKRRPPADLLTPTHLFPPGHLGGPR